MNILPKTLQDVIESLGNLPGVGVRTAERYAYYLARKDPASSNKIAESLGLLHQGIATCPVTFAMMDAGLKVSPLYDSPSRDKTVIAVVADSFDIVAIEKTALFKGTYHVLGGLISPIDGVGPDELHISELTSRIKKDKVKEIILATNAGVEGQTTALYIQQQLEGSKVKITRLAQGLSVGVDLEYADQLSLGRALENRQRI
ncbi:MAG: recombination mediator RecR [bacterium]|nr:recombination mediator RecR [bacterium]